MKIGELAEKTGCRIVTIRYYEKEGLLAEPERTEGNYRIYGKKDQERLEFIMHCRRHGMKLSEIRELLAFKDTPQGSCDWIDALIEKHIDEVSAQIDSLTRLKKQLTRLLRQCSGVKKEECGIIKSLSDVEHCPHCEDFRCRSSG
ncbi:MAG: Cd(II)/Pb(II)-responsive transcriptional regulator [Burkholderiales bacterium]|jgi:Cd(II)/Pb(II)-responsive transcriptional regulator|nr:Cd(II)/Pb(II)-responsive transcriptional regulator [Burkholderiales bacterium]